MPPTIILRLSLIHILKLDSHHIEFVMDCLRDNTTKVRNIKQYLRAMLFNAPSTINLSLIHI